jgi:type IV pilus assembly protein PilM
MAAPNLVGLDIGSMSVRAAETGRGKEGYTVTAYGAVPLPPGVVQAGVVQDEAAVTTALKNLWSSARIRNRTVALGVTNPQIVVRKMSLANLPPAELRKSLPFQVRDSLPLPVERSLLDFFPLGPPTSGEQGEMIEGLLIASPKEAILSAIRATEKAGLTVARVDLGSFALLRAAAYLDAKVEALVDIGGHVTSVVAHVDGIPLIVRTVPRGSAEITEMLASRLNIDPAAAEERKCRAGMDSDADPEVAPIVREAARPLMNEIRSSFAYLNTGERASRVARVLLTGGGSLLPGLREALSQQLTIEVSHADPLIRVDTARRSPPQALDRFRSTAAIPIGLTMGAA